jgi:hypothetical protein
MSDSKTTGNVIDGFGGRLQTDETGVELQAAPGKNINLITTDGGEVQANGSPIGAGGVTSFDGRSGAVVPEANDYSNVPDLELDDGVSAIVFTTGDGSVAVQDGALDSVLCNGGGNLILSAASEVQIVAPSLTLNGNPIAVPTFVDAEVPATFNTNHDYDLLNAPNPLLSLQVFINSEASQHPGQDRLLVQGTDYQLTTGAHGPNTRIHYLLIPTATNSIVCWYRR